MCIRDSLYLNMNMFLCWIIVIVISFIYDDGIVLANTEKVLDLK